jgi:hypothetical protein
MQGSARGTLCQGTGFVRDGAVRAYSCGFSGGAAGCRMAYSQRLRVRCIALLCSRSSLSSRYCWCSRVRYKSRVRMESPYPAIVVRERVSNRVRIDWSVLESRKYLPGFSAAICSIRWCAFERPSMASTHDPFSSAAPEKMSKVSSLTSLPHEDEFMAFG